MVSRKRTIFLTGGTGLLGSYLLKIFLAEGHKVYCLARDKKGVSAEERVKQILEFWDDGKPAAKNLTVLKGDITKEFLGLDAKTVATLHREIEEICHFAAVINFNWLLMDIRRVNVSGTQAVLDFAESCRNKGRLVKVNHISTAYVYGNYQGVFKESDLDVNQKFSNTYEQSKFEAEKIAHQYRKRGLCIDIFRPPIVIGHSLTGKIPRFNNIYQLLNICSWNLFDTLPILGMYLRLIPVDTVTRAIYLISQRTPVRNKTYHIFPRSPVSVEEMIETGCKLMGVRKPRAVLPKDFALRKLTPAQRTILKNNILAIDFKNQLDSEFTCNLLKAYGFEFPELDGKLLSRIFAYFTEKERSA